MQESEILDMCCGLNINWIVHTRKKGNQILNNQTIWWNTGNQLVLDEIISQLYGCIVTITK